LMQALMRWLYPKADVVIAISEGVARDLSQFVPKLRSVRVVYNAGYDENVLRGARQGEVPGLPADGPLIVSCGRLTAQKAYLMLIDAFAEVRKDCPATLCIIGVGEDYESIKDRARLRGVSDSLLLPGFMENPWKTMAAANVFALSSAFEGFGNVIVEAMACGTPVVSTDAPYGPGEIIENGVNGLLVPVGDHAALARAILSVLTCSDLHDRLAQAGKERAANFSAERSASNHLELFHELVESGRQQ
jgi:glycosyltransferase involved in cell wall biosynthesis